MTPANPSKEKRAGSVAGVDAEFKMRPTSRRMPLAESPLKAANGVELPIRSARTSMGVNEGMTERISAAAPATIGVAIEVPFIEP
ncbi:MAG: hypothetical protein WA797_02755 [Acidimicrobiales bacterium]